MGLMMNLRTILRFLGGSDFCWMVSSDSWGQTGTIIPDEVMWLMKQRGNEAMVLMK
jgi:hypothetical protein